MLWRRGVADARDLALAAIDRGLGAPNHDLTTARHLLALRDALHARPVGEASGLWPLAAHGLAIGWRIGEDPLLAAESAALAYATTRRELEAA